MIDATQPGSPGWWLHRLIGKLADKRDHFDTLNSYYEGTNGIPAHAGKSVREAYRRLMAISRTNFAELATEAVRERMQVVGFRTGAVSDRMGDDEAWRIWQANNLDADSHLVHRAKLSMGLAHVIVGGVDPDIGAPLITPEDPREVIVACDPRRRRKRLAAAKVFRDDIASEDVAYVYVRAEGRNPARVLQARRRAQVDSELSITTDSWEWSQVDRMPFDVIPVVPFPNLPDMRGETTGEFERHLPILDRINYTILQRLEVATLQAFRQRAIKGVPTHDAHGNEVDYDDIFAHDPGAMWQLPESAEIWESQQVDLGPIRSSVRDDVQDFAAVTRTPLFYLTPEATNGSAEGASLSREGLIFKTGERLTEASDPWEDVMSLAFLFSGDTGRAARPQIETMWMPPERFSLAERYDAAAKAQAAGLPWRSIMADVLQFSPTEVNRMDGERSADLFLQMPPAAE